LPVPSYTPSSISTAFATLKSHSNPKHPSTKYEVRAALFNAGFGVWKPFLDVTPAEVKESVETNIEAPFAFAREAILAFKQNDIIVPGDEDSKARGTRGTLIFTGATASLRGNTTTSALAAGKFGLRGLSQSLAKEFGKDNIHVSVLIYSLSSNYVLTGS
jgi:NAD(P)-dependent dehydrogenase (short-subunit alcohol dehydrogenase family)